MYSISSLSLRNFVEILYLWAAVHFTNILQTFNFTTHKQSSPYANIWFFMIINWRVTPFKKPSVCFDQLLMNDCSANLLLSESFWHPLPVYVNSLLLFYLPHTATVLVGFIWMIFLLIAMSFNFFSFRNCFADFRSTTRFFNL